MVVVGIPFVPHVASRSEAHLSLISNCLATILMLADVSSMYRQDQSSQENQPCHRNQHSWWHACITVLQSQSRWMAISGWLNGVQLSLSLSQIDLEQADTCDADGSLSKSSAVVTVTPCQSRLQTIHRAQFENAGACESLGAAQVFLGRGKRQRFTRSVQPAWLMRVDINQSKRRDSQLRTY